MHQIVQNLDPNVLFSNIDIDQQTLDNIESVLNVGSLASKFSDDDNEAARMADLQKQIERMK